MSTTETSESKKVGQIKAAIASMRRELVEMDQKREIVSYEIRRSMLLSRGRGKEDYL